MSLVDHVDIFMDVMRMDHDLDVRDRLDIDEYAISPVDTLIAKLQIGQINEKDVHDVIAMLKDLPLHEADDDVSIDVRAASSRAGMRFGERVRPGF